MIENIVLTGSTTSSLKPGKYKHFKGEIYTVAGTAKHSETEEEHVIYFNTASPDKVWIRPLKNFKEYVFLEGERKLRFELLENE